MGKCNPNRGFKLTEIALILSGVVMFIWSWVSEIYFHYIAGFTAKEVGEELFWRAEYSELVNSMFLFVGGIVLIAIGLYLRWKRVSCEEIDYAGKCVTWRNKL